MESTVRQSIYDRISAKGLIGEVLDEVRKQRPKASRNTIHLAFTEGATTPARRMILEIAEQVLNRSEETINAATLAAA